MKKLIINRMDLVLTTKCTLKCEKCANLMQYYEKSYDVELSTIYRSVQKMIKAIDSLNQIYVLGGEPFVYSDLESVISFLIPIKKIKEIIVVTNGTICPNNPKLSNVLSNEKVVVRISDYGKLSRNIKALISMCEKEKIKYILDKKDFFYDTGNMKSRNRTNEELNKVFLDCATQCRSLFNGELHYCPRSAHGTDLGFVPKELVDYIDIINCPEETLRKKINDFHERINYIKTCDYCDIRTPGYYERIEPLAKQVCEVTKLE